MATNVTAQTKTFSKTDARLYVPVTLFTQDNSKLLEQLKCGFIRTNNWNKYQAKVSAERPNQYLDLLIDSSFQRVNRLFVLSFENATCQGNDYTTGCLIEYNKFKKYFNPISIDLSKQQVLDADLNAIEQISFTGNLE